MMTPQQINNYDDYMDYMANIQMEDYIASRKNDLGVSVVAGTENNETRLNVLCPNQTINVV